MYRHILLAVDGSDYALEAARYGLRLAKATRARVSVLMVTAPWQSVALSEIALGHFEEEYAARVAAYAEACLSKVRSAAAELGVACETGHATGARPYEAILESAKRGGCDLIVVGSHGHRGLTGLLLGSETVKVLTHSKVPVLVYRR